MAQVTGVLERINTRDGRYGPQVSYLVNGDWYGGGKYVQRDVREGDVVQLTYEVNPRGFKDLVKHGGIIKQSSGASDTKPETSAPSTGGRAATTTAAPYVDVRQDTISKQAAFNTALTYLDLQIKLGGIKFPASAKAPDIFAAFETMVNTEAARLYNLNTGKIWVFEESSKPAVVRAPLKDEYESDN